MKHFLFGVAVGAIAMGYHTGYIRVFLGDDPKAPGDETVTTP